MGSARLERPPEQVGVLGGRHLHGLVEPAQPLEQLARVGDVAGLPHERRRLVDPLREGMRAGPVDQPLVGVGDGRPLHHGAGVGPRGLAAHPRAIPAGGRQSSSVKTTVGARAARQPALRFTAGLFASEARGRRTPARVSGWAFSISLDLRVPGVVGDHHLEAVAVERLLLERVQQPAEAKRPPVGGDQHAQLGRGSSPRLPAPSGHSYGVSLAAAPSVFARAATRRAPALRAESFSRSTTRSGRRRAMRAAAAESAASAARLARLARRPPQAAEAPGPPRQGHRPASRSSGASSSPNATSSTAGSRAIRRGRWRASIATAPSAASEAAAASASPSSASGKRSRQRNRVPSSLACGRSRRTVRAEATDERCHPAGEGQEAGAGELEARRGEVDEASAELHPPHHGPSCARIAAREPPGTAPVAAILPEQAA